MNIDASEGRATTATATAEAWCGYSVIAVAL